MRTPVKRLSSYNKLKERLAKAEKRVQELEDGLWKANPVMVVSDPFCPKNTAYLMKGLEKTVEPKFTGIILDGGFVRTEPGEVFNLNRAGDQVRLANQSWSMEEAVIGASKMIGLK